MIKNLPLQLNEAGKIKIGIKGDLITSAKGNEFRPPQKLDHFILTTTEKNDAGDYVVDTELMNRIKENGTGLVNDDGNLVGIPVRLIYENVEQNFPTRYACYAGRKLACYGDGEKAFRRIDDYKKEYPCPCDRLDPDYDGDNKCKANGRLICMIDEAGLFGQVHVFRTTSINSVKGIWGGMELIKVATKGRLAGVPLMLTLNAKHTDHGISYVVSICFNGTMEMLRNSVHELAVKEQVYLLEAPGAASIVEPGTDDEQAFVDEFYPDAATESSEADTVSTNQSREVPENVPNRIDTTDKDNIDKKTGGVHPGIPEGNNISANASPEDKKKNNQANHVVCDDRWKSKTSTEQIKQEEAGKTPVPPGSQTMPGVTSKINIEFRLLKESCSYNTLYNRFIVALGKGDYEDAMKLAPRMDKDRLEKFFTRERPDIKFRDSKPKKTDYLDKLSDMVESAEPILFDREPGNNDHDEETAEEHPFLAEIRVMETRDQIAKAMVEFFRPIPVNLTLDRDGLIAWAEQKIGVDEVESGNDVPINPSEPGKTTDTEQPNMKTHITKPELFPYNPVSGVITEDQLRTIVKLKNKLEKKGLLQKENWPGVIAEFATTDGKPATTATAFCFDQGFELIERLNSELPEAEKEANIPF